MHITFLYILGRRSLKHVRPWPLNYSHLLQYKTHNMHHVLCSKICFKSDEILVTVSVLYICMGPIRCCFLVCTVFSTKFISGTCRFALFITFYFFSMRQGSQIRKLYILRFVSSS